MEYLLLYVTGIVITLLYILIVGEGTKRLPGGAWGLPAALFIAVCWPVTMLITLSHWFAEGID